MTIIINGETYVNPKEASSISGRAINTIYCKYKSWGWIPYSYGSNILFKKLDIESWLLTQIRPKNDVKELDINSQINTKAKISKS